MVRAPEGAERGDRRFFAASRDQRGWGLPRPRGQTTTPLRYKGDVLRTVLKIGYAGVLLVLAASAAFGSQAVAAQPAPCRFVLGFAELRDLIGPDIVGECLEDQWSTEGGDAVQRTTKGVMS